MAKLDEITDRILHELSRDGRLSNIDLADRVGLSPSACLRRVQELERVGLIKGYRAVLDRDQLGAGFTVYVMVGLSDHSKASQDRFETAMLTAPEVAECHNVSGVFEYLLRVEVADLAAYKSFHTDKLGQVPNVNAINSYMVMGSPKNMRG